MDDSEDGPGRRWGQRLDLAHEQVLLRELAMVNERTWRELGPLPPGGLPVMPKRKPQLPRPAVPPMVTARAPTDEDSTMQWKSVVAVAALATGSALTACGAEGTAARVDPLAVAVPDAAATAPVEPMPAVAAVPPTTVATEINPTPPIDQKASEPVRGPAIPAAQLRRQILALLGSFEKLEDLEKANVETALNIELIRQLGMEDGYQYFGKTSEGWNYRATIERLGRMQDPPTIKIYLNNGIDVRTDQQSTYCTVEFEPLAKEIVAMGYHRTEKMFRLKGKQWWGFRRVNTDARAVIGAMVYVYRTPDDDSGHYCVKSISFGGDPLDG